MASTRSINLQQEKMNPKYNLLTETLEAVIRCFIPTADLQLAGLSKELEGEEKEWNLRTTRQSVKGHELIFMPQTPSRKILDEVWRAILLIVSSTIEAFREALTLMKEEYDASNGKIRHEHCRLVDTLARTLLQSLYIQEIVKDWMGAHRDRLIGQGLVQMIPPLQVQSCIALLESLQH